LSLQQARSCLLS